MAKTKISEWEETASNNSDVGGIDIAENCAAANVNNAMREMMGQIATARTGDDDGIVTGTAGSDGDLAAWNADGDLVSSESRALRGYIEGLEIANNSGEPNTDIDITAGAATSDNGVSANRVLMELTSTMVKRLDATWVAGTNLGGLDTGSVAVDTWYHVFLIKDSTNDIVDVLFSTSISSPTMPTNYTKKRRIASILTDGSSNIIAFSQRNNEFLWDVQASSFITANPGTSAVTATLQTPDGINVRAICSVFLQDSGAAATGNTWMVVSPLAIANLPPSNTNFTLGLSLSAGAFGSDSCEAVVRTSTSRTIRYRLSTSDAGITAVLSVKGWYDDRGRNS